MKKRIVSILLSSVLVVSSMTACTGGETQTGSTTVEVKDEEGNTQQIEVKDTATGEVKVDDKGDVSYEVKDLYIVVDGTLTATADNGQAEFVAQWEEAVGKKLGHEVKLHINQLDHSEYPATVSRLLTTGEPGDGSFPDAMIMSASMFRQYQTTGYLWDLAKAYDNAEFQSRVTLPEVNLGIRSSDGKQLSQQATASSMRLLFSTLCLSSGRVHILHSLRRMARGLMVSRSRLLLMHLKDCRRQQLTA